MRLGHVAGSTFLLLALQVGSALAQQEVPFSGATWSLQGDIKPEMFEGRQALRVRNGSARLMDVEFESGTLEFDVRTTGHRSFVGLGFRIEGSHREDPAQEGPPADSGLVAAWDVSNAFAEPEDLERPPAGEGWKAAVADAQGRLNLARWAEPIEGPKRSTVLARLVLEADRARTVRMGFRSQRYLGVMRVDNDLLYLPLKQGRNEVLFAVSEAFGGWGLTARLIDRDGIAVRTRQP